MANLSEADRIIIAEHPLDNSLDHLRDALREAETSYTATDNRSVQDAQKATSKLLLALLGSEAATYLDSKLGSPMSLRLASLRQRVQKGEFNYEHYRALVRVVIREASDVDIWVAVFNLIVTVSRLTPPASIAPSFDDTPVRHSSSSLQGDEQLADQVEARVLDEIKDFTYRDVGGFFTKYFEGKDWTERTKKIYAAVKDRYVDGKWTDLPNPAVQNAVLKWWLRLQEEFLSDEQGIYCSSINKALAGSDAQGQIDIFVKPRHKVRDEHDWRDVEVVGELSESESKQKAKILQLGRYMRNVFATQPTRRFIHGFTLLGTTMELWVFDRSGPYSSGKFDIHKEPEKFVRAIAGYVMMNNEELGLDTFIERDEGNRFVSVPEDVSGKEKRIQLEQNPIVIQRLIVCRGTSCHRSRDLKHVVKFSWTSGKRRPEADLLRLARQRGVKGVVQLVGHHTITSITEMRKGLTFNNPYSFRKATPSAASSFSQAQQSASQSFTQLRGLSIMEGPQKRKSVDVGGRLSKRSRSNSQKSSFSKQESQVIYGVEEAQTTSSFAENDGPFDNRILRCLVISPAGWAISKFNMITELLEALRDAIRAHRSLYVDGHILHRDISENNIIITNPEDADGFKGMLIDLDLAKEVGSGRSGARCQTGTMEFMAIEVLLNVDHTYRHDLESFFYVLIWQCGRRGWAFLPQDQPKESLLRKWYTGSFEEIASIKRGNMDAGGFERLLLKEFPPLFDCVKPLCRELRRILFPIHKDELFTGTLRDPEVLYGPVLKAFDNAIRDIVVAETRR
ncbi:MAG: hypothetical protein M1816_001848 [Peltula sp. TS41687]|nr:MAG: hypothetical protein M1816_001848 [Peltula sp. TS41687]